MKNIDYLTEFFKKHNLTGKVRIKYSSSIILDEYISDIIFENGDVVNINDIRFDIDSDFPNDIFDQWIIIRREEDISLLDWLKNNTHYFPKNIDNSSVEEYKKELESVVDDIKENINKLFQMETDDGDSDLYGSEDE